VGFLFLRLGNMKGNWKFRGLAAWKAEARPIMILALPIMSGMLSHTLIGLVDTIMVGRLGLVPLAAASLVNVLVHPGLVFSVGLLSAVAVLSSQAFGAKRPRDCGEALRNGLIAALVLGAMHALAWHGLLPFLHVFGQDTAVVEASRVYLSIFAWSVLPALLTHACKQFCESLDRAWVPNILLLSGVVLNAFLNWVLIYGKLGAPPLGLEGAGWATLLARVATFGAMFAYVLSTREFLPMQPISWLGRIRWAEMRALFRIGGPVAVQHLFEVGAFAFAAIMMGWISAAALAAHQIAITCAATTFMLALGIGMAVCIRVGHAWGAGDGARVRRIGFIGLGLGGAVMSACAVVLMAGRYPIVRAFVSDPAVVAITVQLLVVAALFQLADGMQVTAISALRGVSDVRIPAGVAVLAYWVVAIPAGYLLGFHTSLGPAGVWAGLAIGLGVAAVFLTWRFHHVSQRHVAVTMQAPTGRKG
jgi:MATE family multidrug resistance protein